MTDVITRGLRDSVRVDRDDLTGELRCWLPADDFRRLCDEVDAVDANLGAELAEWGERGVLLPLDADGVPVRLDDLMEWPDHTGDPFEVIAIGNGTLYYVDDDGIQWTHADTKRHHHAPTVEDVLREFAVEVCGEPALTIRSGVVEEYASRLRLAGDGA